MYRRLAQIPSAESLEDWHDLRVQRSNIERLVATGNAEYRGLLFSRMLAEVLQLIPSTIGPGKCLLKTFDPRCPNSNVCYLLFVAMMTTQNENKN